MKRGNVRRAAQGRRAALGLGGALSRLTLVGALGLGVLVATPAAAEKITITMWTLGPTYQEPIKHLMPIFNKEFPNVDLQWIAQGPSPKLDVAFAAGVAPDIVTYSTRNAPRYVSLGLFQPVDFSAFKAYLQPNQLNDKGFESLWAPGLAGTLKMNGGYYYIPTEVTPFATFYNTAMFAEAGLDKPAATWQGLDVMAKKLKRADADGKVTQWGMALQHGGIWNEFHMISMMRQNGVNWISPDGKPQFSAQKSIEAIDVYKQLYVDGAMPENTSFNMFTNHQAAIYPGALYQFWSLHGAGVPADAVAYPVLDGGQPVSPSYAWGTFVTKTSKHPQLAWQVAEFFSDQRWAKDRLLGDLSSLLIPWRGSWLVDAYKAFPPLQAFFDDLGNAQAEPETPHYSDLDRLLLAAEKNIIEQKMSTANALQQLDQQLAPILAQAVAPVDVK